MTTKSRAPVIILFSLPGCAFCDVVRQHYLAPLLRDAASGRTPVIREIVITGSRHLHDFQGKVTQENAISRKLKVHVAPTVLMLDQSGRLLAPPLIGGDTAGFYGAYLDRAIEESVRQMKFP